MMADMDIAIRPAHASDLDRLCSVMYDDPPRDLLAVVPDRARARKVGALTIRYGFEFDLRQTSVATHEGMVVGLMELRRPGTEAGASASSALTVLVRALPLMGVTGLLRFARHRRARSRVNIPQPPDALYVGELDVHPEFRNRGIGGALLEHADAEARREAFSRLALSTTTINPAQHLYARHGYRIVETRLDAGYERLTGIPGRVSMVKELE
jgi:ribosomal protein S18 acetylase RimI-like enzyme